VFLLFLALLLGGAAHVVCGNYEWAHRDALGQDSGSDEAPLLVRQLAV
jgi:hypothetical protein